MLAGRSASLTVKVYTVIRPHGVWEVPRKVFGYECGGAFSYTIIGMLVALQIQTSQTLNANNY